MYTWKANDLGKDRGASQDGRARASRVQSSDEEGKESRGHRRRVIRHRHLGLVVPHFLSAFRSSRRTGRRTRPVSAVVARLPAI